MRLGNIWIVLFATALAACSREEDPAANTYERQKAEIESKALELERQVANDVAAVEARLEREANEALMNRVAPADANEADAAEE